MPLRPATTYTVALTDRLTVLGRFAAPDYRDARGQFVIDAGHRPVVQGSEDLEFLLTVPLPDAGGAPPYPVVLLQHGLASQRKDHVQARAWLAHAGFATLSIDAVAHGARARGPRAGA